MNAKSIPPANGAAAEVRRTTNSGERNEIGPEDKGAFETLLSKAGDETIADTGEEGALIAMGGNSVCSAEISSNPLTCSVHSLGPGASSFGSTYRLPSQYALSRGSAIIQNGVALASEVTRRVSRQSERLSMMERAEHMRTESVEQWIREVVQALYVADRRSADESRVMIELKGTLLAGSNIAVSRSGQRLCIEISAGTLDSYRALQSGISSLQAALEAVMPDAILELSLQVG